jgi:YD repeat-containing protein
VTTITYDGNAGLSAVTTFEYDTDQDAVGSPLNVTVKHEYGFLAVPGGSTIPAGEAPPSLPVTLPDPTTGPLIRVTEITYKTDTTYKNANILKLPTQVLIKDTAGNVDAKSQITYDESTYLVSDTPTGTVPGWVNLGTSVRGLPTTSATWYDITYNLSVQTHTQFNQFGSPRKNWDANGNVSQIDYTDNFDTAPSDRHTYAFPTLTISAEPDSSGVHGSNEEIETKTTYKFDAGLPTSISNLNILGTSSDDAVTTMEYFDPLLRPTKVTAPNGQQTITEYGAGTDSSTRYVKIKSQIDANNWKQGYTWFDGLGRTTLTQKVDTDGDVYVHMEYDSAGRMSKVSNPYRNISSPSCLTNIECTTNTYDSAGRPWKVTTPDSAVVQTTYSIATSGSNIGTTVTVTDQAGKLRRSVTDALGRLSRVDEPTTATDPLGPASSPNQATSYTYDLLNNLTNVTQGSQTRTFSYDAMSRLKSATNPESGTVSYSYDSNGNLTSKTDARSITTTYTYDTLNRVQMRSYNDGPTPTATYYYDNLTNAKGKLIKASNANSTTEFTSFDILGRVTGHKQTTDGTDYTTAYSYNLAGALVDETYPSGRVVRNALDANGDLSVVESKKNAASGFWQYANSFSYTPSGVGIEIAAWCTSPLEGNYISVKVSASEMG